MWRETLRKYWYMIRAMHDDDFDRFHYLRYAVYFDFASGQVMGALERTEAAEAAEETPGYIGSARSRYTIQKLGEDVRNSLLWEARCNDEDCGVFPSYIPTWKSAIPVAFSKVLVTGKRGPIADHLTLPDSVLVGSSPTYEGAWRLFKDETLRSQNV